MSSGPVVANDPVNRSDPSGELARGDGFTDDQWKQFDKFQQATAKDMNGRADKFTAKADKMDAASKSGGDRLRKEAANLHAGAAALSATGNGAPKANLLSDAAYATLGRPASSGAFSSSTASNFPVSSIFGDTASGPKWIIGHEAMHTKDPGPGLSDERGPNNAPAYRFSPFQPQVDAYRALRGTDLGAQSPDNLMGEVYP